MNLQRAACFLWAGIFILVFSCDARAEVVFSGIKWQTAFSSKGQKSAFRDAQAWLLPPRQGHEGRPRALVTLSNRGAIPEGASVLRYAFSVRLVRIEGKSSQTWAIPLIVEERRIPQTIPAHSSREISINVNRIALDAYLKRIYRAGFWPDALRIQVELEPRPGETFKNRTLEATLPIAWTVDGTAQ